MKKISSLAFGQIILLVASIVAVSYMIGSEIPSVSAQGGQCVIINGERTTIPADRTSELWDWCVDNDPNREICHPKSGSNNAFTRPEVMCPNVVPIPSTPLPTPSLKLPDFSKAEKVAEAAAGVPSIPEGYNLENVANANFVAGSEGLSVGSAIITILKNAAWAAAIYLGTKFVLGQLGVDSALANSLSLAAAGGYFAASTAAKFGLSAKLGSLLGISGGLATAGIGLVVGAVIFFATFKKTEYQIVSFSCYPWDAPIGGKYCEECNKGDMPCTEYRCKSLGQACELINKGTNEELCVWKNRNDVNPPVIQPWEDALTTNYKYIPDGTISPPDRGVQIVKEVTNGCVAPFTPLKFGVMLDEPAKCKIDPLNKDSFKEMQFFFGGSSTSKYNHSQQMSLPSPEALAAENITLQNDGQFVLYARCEDANGNANTANFVFKFCVDKGPDTTPPLIITTSILNGMPIAYNQTSADLQVYVNEPAECRWGKLDQSYDNMETQMVCSTNVLEMNAQMLYRCSTTLTGLKDRTDNNFYFRCKDQPHLEGTNRSSDRNTNSESYKFTLKGTQPLVIDSVEPNGTIKDSTTPIRVTLKAKTSAGYNEGEAICYFSDTGDEDSFIEFFETSSYRHSQDLYLIEGDYTYTIKCVDLGGNSDTMTTSFSVEADSTAPVVVRVFREESKLKIITNEEASCVYDNIDCSYDFDDANKGATKMITLDDRVHSIEWNSNKNFYIKCEDEFGNRPLPNQCSIIARPFEI